MTCCLVRDKGGVHSQRSVCCNDRAVRIAFAISLIITLGVVIAAAASPAFRQALQAKIAKNFEGWHAFAIAAGIVNATLITILIMKCKQKQEQRKKLTSEGEFAEPRIKYVQSEPQIVTVTDPVQTQAITRLEEELSAARTKAAQAEERAGAAEAKALAQPKVEIRDRPVPDQAQAQRIAQLEQELRKASTTLESTAKDLTKANDAWGQWEKFGKGQQQVVKELTEANKAQAQKDGATIAELHGKLRAIEQTAARDASALQQTSLQVTGLQQTLQTEKQKAEATIKALREELQGKEGDLVRVADTRRQALEEASTLQSRIAGLESQLAANAGVASKLAATEAQIAKLTSEKDQAAQKVQSTEAAFASAQADASALQSKIAGLESQLAANADLSSKLADSEAAVAKLTSQRDKAAQLGDQTAQQFGEYREKMQVTAEENTALRAEIQLLRAAEQAVVRADEGELEILRKERDALKAKQEAQEKLNKDIQARVDALVASQEGAAAAKKAKVALKGEERIAELQAQLLAFGELLSKRKSSSSRK